MSDDLFHMPKMADAIPHPDPKGDDPSRGGAPDPTGATVAEQRREAQENDQAHHAQGDLKDRLVEIGKAHHMAGRGTGRVSDS